MSGKLRASLSIRIKQALPNKFLVPPIRFIMIALTQDMHIHECGHNMPIITKGFVFVFKERSSKTICGKDLMNNISPEKLIMTKRNSLMSLCFLLL